MAARQIVSGVVARWALAIAVLLLPLSALGAGTTLLVDTAFEPALAGAIDGAHREVVVGMYLFKADGPPTNRARALVRRLGKAVGRGVRVRVVLETTSGRGREVAVINHNTAKLLRDAGVTVLFDAPGRRSHGKFAVVDGHLCFIGSHNWTESALRYNHEVSVEIDDAALGRELVAYADQLAAEGTRPGRRPAPEHRR